MLIYTKQIQNNFITNFNSFYFSLVDLKEKAGEENFMKVSVKI